MAKEKGMTGFYLILETLGVLQGRQLTMTNHFASLSSWFLGNYMTATLSDIVANCSIQRQYFVMCVEFGLIYDICY